MRLDPYYAPIAPHWLGIAYSMRKEYTQALVALRECVSRAPNFWPVRAFLAATYAQLGQKENAEAEVSEVLRIDPTCTLQKISIPAAFKRSEDLGLYFDGLRKAGLSEK